MEFCLVLRRFCLLQGPGPRAQGQEAGGVWCSCSSVISIIAPFCKGWALRGVDDALRLRVEGVAPHESSTEIGRTAGHLQVDQGERMRCMLGKPQQCRFVPLLAAGLPVSCPANRIVTVV